jgi:hypothetical protein
MIGPARHVPACAGDRGAMSPDGDAAMDENERAIIDDLFARLQEAERRSGPRDAEAEAAIREHVATQPSVPYYMAQAIVVQQEAMKTAQRRIQDLERQLAERPAGGFLSGLFGGGESPAQPPPAQGARPAHATGPWGARGGGGFLAGAAQTAMGVAGGMLIADALGFMFATNEATATEVTTEPSVELSPEDSGADASADDDGFDSDLGIDTSDLDFDF